MAIHEGYDFTKQEWVKVWCPQCDVIVINGIATHEEGCINSSIDPETGKPWEDDE